MSDLIDLRSNVTQQTFEALLMYCDSHDYDGRFTGTFIEPQWLAWLIAILKAEPDTDYLFPKGKWATIQHLEGTLLEPAARSEIAGRLRN